MNHKTWKEVLIKLRRRYQHAGAEHKSKLLDRAQELLGYALQVEGRLLLNFGRYADPGQASRCIDS